MKALVVVSVSENRWIISSSRKDNQNLCFISPLVHTRPTSRTCWWWTVGCGCPRWRSSIKRPVPAPTFLIVSRNLSRFTIIDQSFHYHQRHLSNCSFHNWKSRQQRPLRVSSLKFSYFLYGKRNQKAHKYENDQADQDIDILSTSNLWTNTKFLVSPVKLWVLSIYSCSTNVSQYLLETCKIN